MTEQELRTKWLEEAKDVTLDTLPDFLKKVTEHKHDYGSICIAIGAAALAAANAVEKSPQGGITGFQAGAVCWEFIRGWGVFGDEDSILQFFDWKNVLFPQYDGKTTTIEGDTWERIQKLAHKHLANAHEFVHPDVLARWKSVAAGEVPAPYVVRNWKPARSVAQ